MNYFAIFLLCIGFLFITGIWDNIQSSRNKKEYEREIRENKWNRVRQFALDYASRELEWEFEDLTGMKKEIIANILSARYDKVPYDPELSCFGSMINTASNAITIYRLKLEGFNAQIDAFANKSKNVDMTIPDDYIFQGKLYKLNEKDLEKLTGLDYERLLNKFCRLNEREMICMLEFCRERVKGIMIRYQMEFEGRQFYGMHDYMFIGSTAFPKMGKDNIDDDFDLADCKNWGTPLKFIA